jgi:ABC-type transport system involved in multi-copper enzyme maturation permease subunit
MIRVLLWKEYHEHRLVWLMLAFVGLALLIGVPQVAQLFEGATAPRDQGIMLETTALAVAWVYGLVCGGMMLAGEQENGTLAFLDALPVRRISVWLVKAFAGFGFVVTLAAVLAGGMSYALAEQHGLEHGIVLAILGVVVAGLYGLGWGLLLSAYCRFVLNAVFLGFLAQIAAGFVIFPFLTLVGLLVEKDVNDRTVTQGALGVLGMAILAVAPVIGSAWVFTRQDFDRLRSKPVREPKAKVRARKGWSALLWLSVRQSRWLALGVGFVSVIAAILMPWLGLVVWPAVTSIVAVVCGATVFLDEQRSGSYRFLGEQRLPLTRVWLVKVGVRLAVVMLAMLVLLLPGVVSSLWSTLESQQDRDRELSLAARLLKLEEFDLRPGWVFLTLWPAYGFTIGLVNGLVFRKGLVAVVLALIECGMIAVLWLPSVVVGGLHFWQVGVLPILLLALSRSLLRPWTSERLLSRGPIVAGIGVYLVGILWLAASFWYRVYEAPIAPKRFDLDGFAKSLPKVEDNKAGSALRRSLARVPEVRKMVNERVAAHAQNPLPATGMSLIDQQLSDVVVHGWPQHGRTELAGWLNDWFADDSWLGPLAEAADQPLGVVESPRDLDINSLLNNIQEARTVVSLLVARGLQEQAAGRPEVFVENLRLGLNLSRNLRHKSPIIMMLVSQAVELTLLSGLDRWLERFDGPPELLARANAVFRLHEEKRPNDPSENAMAEYLIALNSFDRLPEILAREFRPSEDLNGLHRRWALEMLRMALQVPWERARLLRFIRAGHETNLERDPEQLKMIPRWLFNLALNGRFFDRGNRDQEISCRLRADQLKLALRQYQIEKGKPADTLALLVPAYLPAIPLDPFDSQPFRYRLSRGEFIEWPRPEPDPEPLPGDNPLPGEGGGAPPPEGPAGAAINPEIPLGGDRGPPEAGAGMPADQPGGPFILELPAPKRWIPAGQGILWSVGMDRTDDGGRRQEGAENGPQFQPGMPAGIEVGTDSIFLVPPPPLRWPVWLPH